MSRVEKIGSFIGRVFLATYFLWNAFMHIIHWSSYEKNFTTDVMNWHVYISNISLFENIFETILPLGPQLLGVAIVIQVVCGLMLLVAWHQRIAALILAVFILVNNGFTHYFWMTEGYHRDILLQLFMQNLAIFGGLVLTMSWKHKVMPYEKILGLQSVRADHESRSE